MRVMTITMEVSDEEAANLLNRFADRGEVEINETTNVTNVTTTAAPAPAGNAEVDVNGVPWDARYHAGSKGTNKDGSWKALRGMDDATKAAAAQYEASFKNPSPVTETTAAPATPVEEPAEQIVAPATAPVMPAAPVVPMAVPTAPVAPAPVSFEELTAGFQEVIGRIGQDALMAQLGQIYADAGVDSDGTSLQTNETQRAQVLAAIKAL